MSKPIKRIGIIIIVLLFLAGATMVLIPAVMGMNHGYDAALIENKIKDNCKCKSVMLDESNSDSENFTENVLSGKPVTKITLILMDCDYGSFADLSQDILAIVKQDDLCSNKNIALKVNYKEKEIIFLIEDCTIKE